MENREEAMKTRTTTAIVMTIILGASSALAAVGPEAKCRSAKNKITGQYYACRQKAVATAAIKGGMPDFTKCFSKFSEKWSSAESAAASACPDNYPVPNDVEAIVSSQAAVIAGIVEGADIEMPACGDGVINVAGEHCDGAALDGQTCASFGMYGSLSCTAECTADLSACTTCPGSSMPYEGSCWVLGALGADCNAACASVGLVYDSATATVAGSSGTDADCLALLYATGAPGGDLENAGEDCADGGYGCAVITEFGFRARCGTPATTATASYAPMQRMCACQ
jgi:hypothetical protein